MAKGQIKDLTGQRFDKLTAVSCELRQIKKGNVRTTAAYWTCICDCGKTHVTRGSELTTGKCKSCGCNRMTPPNKRSDRDEYLWEVIFSTYCKRNIRFKLTDLWDISLEDFKYLCSQNCFYCGDPPSNVKNDYIKYDSITFKYSSLDRLYSNKPYCLSNVVPCCDTCNTAKASMTPEQWVNWLKRVNKNFIENGKFEGILPKEKKVYELRESFTFK